MKLFVKIAILFSILFVFACKKNNPAPVAPIITFLNAGLSADRSFSIVKFGFYDGDGDLGLKQNENTGQQKTNLLVDYYEKINGNWVLKSPIISWNSSTNKYDTTDLNLRVPFIKNDVNKALQGETTVNLLYNFNADTIKYELTLIDRALHHSNKIATSEIIIH